MKEVACPDQKVLESDQRPLALRPDSRAAKGVWGGLLFLSIYIVLGSPADSPWQASILPALKITLKAL